MKEDNNVEKNALLIQNFVKIVSIQHLLIELKLNMFIYIPSQTLEKK